MEDNNSGNQIINNAQPNVQNNNQPAQTVVNNNQGNGQNYNTQATNNYNKGNEIPKAYKPISAWGYVGWDILFAIPVVGLIILIVFACGGTSNINRKKYARSKFCAFLLGLIIALVIFLVFYFVFGITLTPDKYKIIL